MQQKMTPTNKPTNRNLQATVAFKGQPGIENEHMSDGSVNQADLENTRRIEQIWAERAIQLAKIEDAGKDQGEQVTVVLISLGGELLGLDVQYVFDIRAREAITRVPRVPAWVVGVTNLRGNILSVINLGKYFGLSGNQSNSAGENSGLLVIVQAHTGEQNGAMEIVFLVDDVIGVETIPARQSAVDSGVIHGIRPEYIHFIGERGAALVAAGGNNLAQQHVVILNVENLLTDQRLIIHEETV